MLKKWLTLPHVTQRHKLKGPFTPVTAESFAKWKKERADKKAAEADAKEKAKASQRAAGRVGMSGRHMFEFGNIQEDKDDGDDDDWDIQKYLAGRDKDARATSENGDEEGFREGSNGQQEGDDDDDDAQTVKADGDAAAGSGAADINGKKAGMEAEDVKEVVDKLEEAKLAAT